MIYFFKFFFSINKMVYTRNQAKRFCVSFDTPTQIQVKNKEETTLSRKNVKMFYDNLHLIDEIDVNKIVFIFPEYKPISENNEQFDYTIKQEINDIYDDFTTYSTQSLMEYMLQYNYSDQYIKKWNDIYTNDEKKYKDLFTFFVAKYLFYISTESKIEFRVIYVYKMYLFLINCGKPFLKKYETFYKTVENKLRELIRKHPEYMDNRLLEMFMHSLN